MPQSFATCLDLGNKSTLRYHVSTGSTLVRVAQVNELIIRNNEIVHTSTPASCSQIFAIRPMEGVE